MESNVFYVIPKCFIYLNKNKKDHMRIRATINGYRGYTIIRKWILLSSFNFIINSKNIPAKINELIYKAEVHEYKMICLRFWERRMLGENGNRLVWN